MQNFFLLIQRYFHILLFIALESIAFYFIYQYNIYQNAVVLNSSNEVAGQILKQKDYWTNYIYLGEENKKLQAENKRLRESTIESLYEKKNIKIPNFDSIYKQKFTYIIANVIKNSTDAYDNYITIDQGEKQGIKKGMGVINHSGIVGVVINVTENFSLVMSVLNSKFKVTPKIEGISSINSIVWKYGNPNYAYIEKINSFNQFKIGQKITTSSYSLIFPDNIMIGTIAKVSKHKNSNDLEIKIKLSANFSGLDAVYVVKNMFRSELDSLEKIIQ